MKSLAAFILLFLSPLAISSGYLTPYGTGITIAKYTMHNNGGMTLWVSGLNNPDNCGDTNLVHLKGDLPGHKQMVSAAMAAHAADKKIGLWSSGCSTIPFWGGTVTRPIIHTLWVTD